MCLSASIKNTLAINISPDGVVEIQHPENLIGECTVLAICLNGIHDDVNKGTVAIPLIELTSEHARNQDATWKCQDARHHNNDKHAVGEFATRELGQPAFTVVKGEMTS